MAFVRAQRYEPAVKGQHGGSVQLRSDTWAERRNPISMSETDTVAPTLA